MKKTFLTIATIAATTVIAGSAFAQAAAVTGSVEVKGTVGAKCRVAPGAGSTFSGVIDFGALDKADGTLDTAKADQNASVVTGAFRVLCSGGATNATISATPMINTATAPAGYTNTVGYTATATISLAGGGSAAPTIASGLTPTGATSAATPLGLLSAAAGPNIVVSAGTLASSGDVLVAGSYTGNITVTINPV
jgi:hypothetical protein